MADTQIVLAGSVFSTEVATTAVPIAMGAGGLFALQNSTNIALLTFNSAHGYTQTTSVAGLVTISNATTAHGPSAGNYTYFTVTGATVNTAVNSVTFVILSIPSTTTMTCWCTLSGTNPTVTSANFNPVFVLTGGVYDMTLGANAIVQYNPDNNGYPQIPPINPILTGATFRTLQAASTSAQLYFDGVGQTFVICNGSAGTSRWSPLPK